MSFETQYILAHSIMFAAFLALPIYLFVMEKKN